MLHVIANRLVRGYLGYCPITEGKKHLLNLARNWIRPSQAEQVAWTKHGFRLRLNLKNPEQERIYFYGEHDERYETALLKRLVRPGMKCWDVGANIGYYTCLLARLVGPEGSVVAFEPAAGTRGRLAENVTLNGFQNVRTEPYAVGAVEGTARIFYAQAALFQGTASLHRAAGSMESEDVMVAPLDTLVSRLGAPDFLKIDVEGAQLEVWRGGRRFFSQNAPLVMAELRDSKDFRVLREIEATVRSCGYQIYSIKKHGRLVCHDAVTPEGPRNYLLTKRPA